MNVQTHELLQDGLNASRRRPVRHASRNRSILADRTIVLRVDRRGFRRFGEDGDDRMKVLSGWLREQCAVS